ncbi:hypothetical protein [Nevskia soli]|uniref:hypothetical protein n=1 Tax=Nevskia soli TaxID=418856 RepID=UPI0012F70D78|nr:hypothetical protein [Nevskia soli]
MRNFWCLLLTLFSTAAVADWPYRIIKVECTASEISVIDYSAYNDDGLRRLREKGAVDVDKLSTWRHTNNDLNVPDKPLPYKRKCRLRSGIYEIVLTNQVTDGYSPPNPVITIKRNTPDHRSKYLFKDLVLSEMPKETTMIVISKEFPGGNFIKR